MEEGSGKIDSMKSSQLFQNQFKEQKRRTQDLCRFLMDLGLQEFGGALVQNGFDQVDMLVHLTTEDMNMVMMRAHQQIKLMQAIKTLRPQTTPQTPKLSSQDRLHTPTIRHLKTQPTLPPPPPSSSSSRSSTSTSELLKKQKSKSNSNSNPVSSPQLSSGLMANSFLYTVGNRNWSIQDQVRRACSVCFKLEQQMQKKGECYYCEGCFKIVSDDLLGISIGRSMKYQKLQNQ